MFHECETERFRTGVGIRCGNAVLDRAVGEVSFTVAEELRRWRSFLLWTSTFESYSLESLLEKEQATSGRPTKQTIAGGHHFLRALSREQSSHHCLQIVRAGCSPDTSGPLQCDRYPALTCVAEGSSTHTVGEQAATARRSAGVVACVSGRNL